MTDTTPGVSRANAMSIATLAFGAIAVASAACLILDLSSPRPESA